MKKIIKKQEIFDFNGFLTIFSSFFLVWFLQQVIEKPLRSKKFFDRNEFFKVFYLFPFFCSNFPLFSIQFFKPISHLANLKTLLVRIRAYQRALFTPLITKTKKLKQWFRRTKYIGSYSNSSAPEVAIHPPYHQNEKAETEIQTNKIHWFLCKRFRFSNFIGK